MRDDDIITRSSRLYDNHLKDLEWLLNEIEKKLREVMANPIENLNKDHNKPNIAGIDKRIKDKQSFLDKITRAGKSYLDPIRQITDLIGFRIITHYTVDIDLVGLALEKCGYFQIITDKSQDISERLLPNQFGYLSKHYIVKLNRVFLDYHKINKNNFLKDIEFEIQVRTLLQHTAAVLSHKLTYKQEAGVPKKLLRRLAMFEAILEAADETAIDLQLLRQEIQEEYDSQIAGNKLEKIPVDIESIARYVTLSSAAKKWKKISYDIGWPEQLNVEIDIDALKREPEYADYDNFSEEKKIEVKELEKKKKEKGRDKNKSLDVFNILEISKVSSLKELDNIVSDNELKLKAFLYNLFASLSEKEHHLYSNVYDILRAIIIKAREQSISREDLKKIGYTDDLIEIYDSLCSLKK